MRKWLFGGFLGAATIIGVACGGGGDVSEFVPPPDEGGTTETPQPPSFGEQPETGAGDAAPNDAAIDCDANPGACLPPAVCGDKKAGLGESCDDGNTTPGDGCSATCQIEAPYWACAFGSLCIDVRDCTALADAGGDGGCVIPPKAAVCGDGFIDPGEACDDSNTTANDGCALDCKAIEANFACPTPGAKCVSTMVCGDGVLQGTEQCDDGNTSAKVDGCSATCTLDSGWVCPIPGTACNAAMCGDGKLAGAEECDDGNNNDNDGCSASCKLQTTTVVVAPTTTTPGSTTIINWECLTPGMPCTMTTCGQGGVATPPTGTEQCDDGNTKALDGCSPDCQLEPNCPNGACLSSCGDGLLYDFDSDGKNGIDEECDDGNKNDGDGCDHLCKKEVGYDCNAVIDPDPAFIDVPVVLRDFKFAASANGHPDFEKYACNEVTENLVKDVLASGVPEYRYDGTGLNPATGTDTNSFCGGTAAADRSQQLTSAAAFAQWYTDTAKSSRVDGTQLRLTRTGVAGDYSYVFDSATDAPYNSLGGFYPLDGKGFGNEGKDAANKDHNFAFTTELRFAFTYDATKSPELTFSGDDDVWVFVNGTLALDLGGLHAALTDKFILDPAKATALNLKDKHVYEIVLFHAERHTNASNFRLTLRGFVKKKSVCANICGDGVKTKEEQCDKGMANTNSGAYGSCKTNCTLGPYCGDKNTTNPPEQCDDGTNLTSYSKTQSTACGPSCKSPAYCGDAVVQGTFGEQCDNGTAKNTGAYGQCNADCTVGPRCGDHATQAASGETCDNGFNLTSYVKHPTIDDCAPGCKKPRSCGDGVVDFPFEQCDKGAANANNGAYDGCTTECLLGPRCGDNMKNGPEQCDDGNRTNGDGCSAACLVEGMGPK